MTPMQPPAPTVADPAFTKLADQAAQALAGMYKMCHQQAPDSPLCEGLTQMQKVVAEIEAQYNSGGATAAQDAPPMDPAAEPMDPMGADDPAAMEPGMEEPADPNMVDDPAAAMPPEEPSGQSSNPMFDAAASVQAEMQNKPKKR